VSVPLVLVKRARCDELCLWHLCPRAACRRRRGCGSRDPDSCLKRFARLVPEEARRYILLRMVAYRNGVAHPETDPRLAEERAALEAWRAVCCAARGGPAARRKGAADAGAAAPQVSASAPSRARAMRARVGPRP
jgi:hypothetical protein